jgi:hypothetical protein
MACLDLVGPLTTRTPAKTHSLLALKMMDSATGWFEIVKDTNKLAKSTQNLFHKTRFPLAHYSQPQFTIFDNRSRAVSSNKCVCKTIMAFKPNKIEGTTINQQANGIIERVHKVVNDMLRSFDLENNHENLEEQEDNPFDYFLQSTAWVIRSTVVFGIDMIHNIAFRANWD